MKYKLEYTDSVLKKLGKLDKPKARLIVDYMREIEKLEDPRTRGKQLTGNLAEYWRYRVEDFRILCKIQDDVLVILVIEIGNRKNVYKKR
jgi:mRNA interferase RelE/StbE